MDTRCSKCGEPYGVLDITEEADYYGYTPTEMHRLFAEQGCAAIGATCNPNTLGSDTAYAVSVLQDILGDDIDGLASTLEDLEYYGLI